MLKNNFDYFNLTPLMILIWALFSISFVQIIPVASGFGWDGIFYGKVALDFQNMIGNIDSYHASRIFPSVLIHYLYRIIGMPLNLETVMFGFQIYNTIVIVSASIIWILLSKLLSLSKIAKWVGFIALFINYPLLNHSFYLPASTDSTAFLIGLLMLYFYKKNNQIMLLVTTGISYFSWPAAMIIGFILFVFARTKNTDFYYKKKKTPIWVFILLLSPLLIFIGWNFIGEIKHIIVTMGLDGIYFRPFTKPGDYEPLNGFYLVNGTLNGVYFVLLYWYMLRNININKIIITIFDKKLLLRISILLGLLLLLFYTKNLYCNSDLKSYNIFFVFGKYFSGPNVAQPLKFITSYVSYWGPLIILFLFYFRSVVSHLWKNEIGLFLSFLYIMLFSVIAEARFSSNFYPLIVVTVVSAINFEKIKKKGLFFGLFLGVSFLFSKVWLKFELPSSMFPNYNFNDLDKFPMQWFFMNMGAYSNSQMYWIHFILVIIISYLFYLLLKRPKLH